MAALNKPMDASKSTARELADEAAQNGAFLAALGMEVPPIKPDETANE